MAFYPLPAPSMPFPDAPLALSSRAPFAQNGAATSVSERLIALLQARDPAALTVLSLLNCSPFTRLSWAEVTASPDAKGETPPLEEAFVAFFDLDDDASPPAPAGSDDLDPDEAQALNAQFDSDPTERPENVSPTSGLTWSHAWNEPLPIGRQAHQNVWGWALSAERPDLALEFLRPWVQQRLTALKSQARAEAVQALLDDRWGFSATLRRNDPQALKTLWTHMTDLLTELPGPWPAWPSGMPMPLDQDIDDRSMARAWVVRAMLQRILQEGDHASWAVPTLTELTGGPRVWTEARLPMPEWAPLGTIDPVIPVLPPVAQAFAGFSFTLAEAMVLAGARIDTPLPDALIDDAPHRSKHPPEAKSLPMPTLLGIAWGAWFSQLPNTSNRLFWEHPLVGTRAMVILLDAAARTSVPLHVVAQSAWRHTNLSIVPDASGSFDVFADQNTVPPPVATPIQPPRLLAETVEQAMARWLDGLPPTMWASPRGQALIPLRQALEAIQLHRTVPTVSDAHPLVAKPRL